MKFAIVERPAVRVAYLRYTGPFGEPLGRFWRGTVGPWLADHGLVDCPRYGVTLDDPVFTHPDKCRYDACVELAPGLSLPDAPETIVRGGLYAVAPFKGDGNAIVAAWSGFIGDFVAEGTHQLDDSRPPFEHYPRGALFAMRNNCFACELCLPVAP